MAGYAGAADNTLPSPHELRGEVVGAASENIEGGFLGEEYDCIYRAERKP